MNGFLTVWLFYASVIASIIFMAAYGPSITGMLKSSRINSYMGSLFRKRSKTASTAFSPLVTMSGWKLKHPSIPSMAIRLKSQSSAIKILFMPGFSGSNCVSLLKFFFNV